MCFCIMILLQVWFIQHKYWINKSRASVYKTVCICVVFICMFGPLN
jgi:hypothetical protein